MRAIKMQALNFILAK